MGIASTGSSGDIYMCSSHPDDLKNEKFLSVLSSLHESSKLSVLDVL